MINVEVIVDIEPVDNGRRAAWWAYAPAVGNLAIAADSLRELEALARAAIDEILEERGGDEVAQVTFSLRNDAPRSAGDPEAGVTLEGVTLALTPDANTPMEERTVPGTEGLDEQRLARELVAA